MKRRKITHWAEEKGPTGGKKDNQVQKKKKSENLKGNGLAV
jgi:hypothetical protein